MSERDVQDSLKFMREKLRKERKAQNMSQLTLSAEADLACNTICRIEKGTAEPGIGNLLRLTDALHIPMSELFPQGEGPKGVEKKHLIALFYTLSAYGRYYLSHIVRLYA